MMKFHHMRTIVAVAEAGSVRGAARRLGLSQPALTKSLGQLERELGAALVQRSARGTQFTELGKAMLARARAIDAELRRACWEGLGEVGRKEAWDNTALVGEILALRHEKAGLLGKAHFADFTTARRMARYFTRHQGDKRGKGYTPGPGYPSAGRVAWALWGGDPGWAWAAKLVRQMNSADKEA